MFVFVNYSKSIIYFYLQFCTRDWGITNPDLEMTCHWSICSLFTYKLTDFLAEMLFEPLEHTLEESIFIADKFVAA